MKITLEKFDFSTLTKDSILMVEISHQGQNDFKRVQNTLKALYDSGKIPRGVLCLINSKSSPIDLIEIPEKIMNQNGWIKLKIQNVPAQSPPAEPLTNP